MKKVITLPLQKLSYLKQVHLEFSMTGKHYEQLVTFQDDNPEQLILSILSDLVEEDASKITEEEARYLFTLIKISNIGSKISANVNCQKCGAKMKFIFDLSEGDIKPLPNDFELPSYKFRMVKDGPETEYKLFPPTLDVVVKFLDWFTQSQGMSRKALYSDKKNLKTLQSFKLKKNLLWLTLGDNKLFDNKDDFAKMDEFLSYNDYRNCANMFFDVQKMEGYGLQPCIRKIKCEECGGSNIFRLPLLYGLIE